MARLLGMDEIKKMNMWMLGLGKPITADSSGYNVADFNIMETFYYLDAPNLAQTIQALMIMSHYSNTQLSPAADNIQFTLNELYSRQKLSVIKEKKIEVLGYNQSCIGVRWDFENDSMSSFVKLESANDTCKWYKDADGKWSVAIRWEAKEKFSILFRSHEYDCCEFDAICSPETPKLFINASVEIKMSDKHRDMLEIKADDEYVMKVIRHLDFISCRKKITYCKLHNITILYNELEKLNNNDMNNIHINLDALKPWKEYVDSWNTVYPIIDLSKIPLKFTPYQFQIDDIKCMLEKRTVLNANDMGCGKTFESVVTGESLPMKKLVICPATLRLNWEREIRMVNPNADIHIIYSSDKGEKKDQMGGRIKINLYATGNDWTIIGYSSIEKFQKELINENFQCVFIDEAHFCQSVNDKGNPNSSRARCVLNICATAGWVYPLTGTPKPTRNKDLYNILRLIRHPLTDKIDSFYPYANYYCGGLRTAYGMDYNGSSHDDELNDKLTPYMIRHLKKEVLPNLKKVRSCIPVQIDLKEYHQAIEEYRQVLKRKNSQAEQLQILMRARKTLAITKAKESIQFAKDIVAQGEKVIIVTNFTDVANKIESAFPDNVVKIVGGMSDKQKDQAQNEFQNGSSQVMVINIIAGGTGLTLTRAHKMIMNDYDWTVGNITQAEDRICRGNQKELCMIYYMTAKGAAEEEKLVDMLTYKAKSIDEAVDNGMGGAINFRSLIEQSE